ncbi:MAG TPA: SIS domain-containing protein [Candidatus Paceibacterota bacterium]
MASFEEAIKKYPEQFSYEPEVKNPASAKFSKFVIAGMGGSGLVPELIKALKPEFDIIPHHDYNLPTISEEELRNRLLIAVSYSGNTKETINFFNQAQSHGLNVSVITTGGELLSLAKEKNVPYIQIPEIGVPPRMAVGSMVRACLKLMGEKALLEELKELSASLEPMRWEKQGEELAARLFNKVAIIYTSVRNQALAYNWKIRLNETGKTPAFFNVLPELAHNEIAVPADKPYPFFILVKDDEDNSRIKKGMDFLEQIYLTAGRWTISLPLEGESRPARFFNSILLADWTSFYLARKLGFAWDEASMIERFKKYGQG